MRFQVLFPKGFKAQYDCATLNRILQERPRQAYIYEANGLIPLPFFASRDTDDISGLEAVKKEQVSTVLDGIMEGRARFEISTYIDFYMLDNIRSGSLADQTFSFDFAGPVSDRDPFELPSLDNVRSRSSGNPEDAICGLSTVFDYMFHVLSVRSAGTTPWNTATRGHGIMFQHVAGNATYFGFQRNEAKAKNFMQRFALTSTTS
jgi:hypothetical protein